MENILRILAWALNSRILNVDIQEKSRFRKGSRAASESKIIRDRAVAHSRIGIASPGACGLGETRLTELLQLLHISVELLVPGI